MQTREITLNISLTDEAARIFDEASYEFDSYFLDELADVLHDVLAAHLRRHNRRISDVVTETADMVAKAMDESNADV